MRPRRTVRPRSSPADIQPRGILVFERGIGYRVRDAYGSEAHVEGLEEQVGSLDARAGELVPGSGLHPWPPTWRASVKAQSPESDRNRQRDGGRGRCLALSWVPEATEAARVAWEKELTRWPHAP